MSFLLLNYICTLSLPAAPCSRIIIMVLSRFRVFILSALFSLCGGKITTFPRNQQTFCCFFLPTAYILTLSPKGSNHPVVRKRKENFRAVRLNSSMTATRSPLNNRVVRSTPGEAEGRTTTLKGSPYTAAGALFQSAFVVFLLPQVLRTLRLLSEDAFSVISTAQVDNYY